MAIEKKIAVDLIEIVGDNIQVRTRTSMMEDGKEISVSFHRHIVLPGECSDSEDARVKAVCAGIHTTEIVNAYRAEQARLTAEAEAARIKSEQEADAQRIKEEQEAAAAEAERAAIAKAEFEKAVGEAVLKALTGGR